MKGLALLSLLVLACAPRALASPEQEERNLEAAREWMALTYDPSTPPSGQAVAHLLAPNCTMHVGSMPQVQDCPMFSDVMGSLLKLAPDFNVSAVDVQFASGDKVGVHFFVAGTHTVGEHNGIPPTGRRMESPGILLFQFDDEGRMTDIYNEWDMMSMWRQLGWEKELCAPA